MTGTKQIYLVVGVPASGKSWVCEQLRELYAYVRHDDFIGGNYVNEIVGEAKQSDKPVLCETPFSVSQIKDPLEAKGFNVTQVFIIESDTTLKERYLARDGKPIPAGHLTRQTTYEMRAREGHAFYGTSAAVLEYLKTRAPVPVPPRAVHRVYGPWPWE